MSDNAGSGDLPEETVRPGSTNEETSTNANKEIQAEEGQPSPEDTQSPVEETESLPKTLHELAAELAASPDPSAEDTERPQEDAQLSSNDAHPPSESSQPLAEAAQPAAEDSQQQIDETETIPEPSHELDADLAAALGSIAPAEDELEHDGHPQFDPDTLANLAALSRITADEDEEMDGGNHQLGAHDLASLIGGTALTGAQVQEFVDSFGGDMQDEEPATEDHTPQHEADDEAESERETLADDGSQRGDEDFPTPKSFGTEDGSKPKRRRNRTVLSCTECHRRKQHCDRNIPCSRCIKRGVPSMCRMETPAMPPRKKKRPNADVPINYELGLRVQALESLIRSGSSMDAEAASTAAMETIMHATRAANSGQLEAANALAQLTQSANLGINGMSQDAQSSLLLDVLQQLSAASMSRPHGYVNGHDSGNYSESRDTWSTVPVASAQSSVQLEASFASDSSTSKVNVSLPGFREDTGKMFHPPTVRYAEKSIREDPNLLDDILPVEGYAPFLESGTRFAYGEDSPAWKNKRIAAIQAVSLTGGLRLAGTFLSRFPVSASLPRSIYVPSPSSDEDVTALRDSGLEIKYFRYLDPKNGLVDWEGMREDLQLAPQRSVILLHISGSIPTGAELTAPQWRMLTTLLQERQAVPLVSMAYQGLTSGDTNRDAQPLRFMIHEGLPVVLVQNFDAMMGLYADSPSIVSVCTRSIDDRDRIDSQLRNIARAMYYRPPALGARIAHHVLSDQRLYPAWLAEIKAMADRLRSVKEKLYDLIANKLRTPGSWAHIKRASGMYCTLLLPQSQMDSLITKRHIHLLPESCVSLACLNAPKIDALARGVDWVVREAMREAAEQAEQAIAMELALQAAKEQQAREDAEARAAAEAAAAAAAQAEDAMLMEESIQTAMEAQRMVEEEERRRDEESQLLEEQVRKAAERAEIERQAELILGSIVGA